MIHIFIFVPLFSDIATFAEFLTIVRVTLLPMIFANTLGVMLFCYIIHMKGYSLTTRFMKENRDIAASDEEEKK